MNVKIFSRGPSGLETTHPRDLSDAATVAERLRVAGHKDILVGSEGEDALPFEQWRTAAAGVSFG